MIIAKTICLFVGFSFTLANIYRLILKNRIPAGNVFAQAGGITGFIICQWLL